MIFPKMALTAGGDFYARFFIEIPKPTTDYLYDLSGSLFTIGAYDTFQAYGVGSEPGDGGYGWSEPWTFVTRYFRTPISDDFIDTYTANTNVSQSNGGNGWGGVWNVIEGI